MRVLAAALLAVSLAACGGEDARDPADRPGNNADSASGGIAGRPVSAAAEAAGVVRLTPTVIVDRQGFGAPLEAVRLLAPAGWRVNSDVVWHQGGCGVGLAQPVFTLTSPDGLSAIELGDALNISAGDYQFDSSAMQPHFVDLARQTKAKLTADQAQLAERQRQARGPCFTGSPTNAQELARTFVLPYRRANARVLSVKPIPGLARTMDAGTRQMHASLPGAAPQTFADAVSLDMDYPTVDARVVERMTVAMGGTRYVNPGLSGDRWIMDSYLTLPVMSVRAPRDRFDQTEAVAAAVFGSMMQNPAWTGAIARLNAELSRIRAADSAATLAAIANRGEIARQAREAVSDMQMQSWRAGNASSDRQQQARIDAVYEVERRVDPSSGAVVPLSIHYQGYWSNGRGDVLMSTRGGLNPRELFPGENWQEMPEAR